MNFGVLCDKKTVLAMFDSYFYVIKQKTGYEFDWCFDMKKHRISHEFDSCLDMIKQEQAI
jgi:hypothetical protein